MEGGYGIAAGITQGLQSFNQGMLQAESIKASREQRRMAAEQHAAKLQIQQTQQSTANMQLQAMEFKLKQMEQAKAKEDVFNAFNAYEETGDIKYLNLVKEKNPLIGNMLNSLGTVSMHSIEEFSPEKLNQLGYKPGMYTKPIVVTKQDGSQAIEDLTGTYAASGYLKEMRKDKLENLVMRLQENKVMQAKTELGNEAIKGELTSTIFQDIKSKVDAGEITPEEAWKLLNNKGKSSSEMKPFDIQTAEYFGGLKTKMDNGVATPEETATYNSWLTKEGGSAVAANEKISTDINKLESKGVNLNDPKFNLDKVEEKDKVAVNTAIRDLENTPGGKKLVGNISKKLGDGMGAVQAASTKLADLATKENVSTAIVKNQIDAIKQYVPEELKDVTEEDLKDVEFRQAFLSVTAAMLKMQSGLTVSEAEAKRFADSMGTLNKNTKVNMSGLKNKVDEIIGDYEANSYLEPTLYNAKYRTPIEGLKSVSTQLDKYLANDTPKYKVGTIAKNPKTGETLIFDGKEWKKQ